LTITSSSGDASGPDASFAIPGFSWMKRTCSPPSPLVISLSAPERITITVSSSPVAAMALRKPSAIERTPTNTMTTPTIPKIATAEEPRRWRIDRRLTLVTAII
jgi:hypothetical protein